MKNKTHKWSDKYKKSINCTPFHLSNADYIL